MPRIDPLQLLKCLSVLLNPTGGIKSKDEVQRLASLMTKFSKKLVSKCIYVSILKATETNLLVMFMSAGGWDLIFTWLSDGVAAKNWPLVIELLDLLLLCPVTIERLKANACPKLVKTLSKDVTANENSRFLACKLVENWLKVVRGECDPEPVKEEVDVKEEAVESCSDAQDITETESEEQSAVKDEDLKSGETVLPVYKITIRDGKQVLAEVFSGDRTSVGRTSVDSTSGDVGREDSEIDDDDDDDDDYEIKPVKVSKKHYVNKNKVNNIVKKPLKVKNEISSRDSVDSSSSSTSSKSSAKKEEKKLSEKKNKDLKPSPPKDSKKKFKSSSDKLSNNKDKYKEKKTEKKETEKKEVEKERLNKDKTEKELLEEKEFKESISKIITPSISKLGKIPKKTGNKEEEDVKGNKVLTSPEKKSSEIKKAPEIKKPEKKYTMSVETKRSSSNEPRPKTVKTFNSKFRSTGLEETPPPPKPLVKKPLTTAPAPVLTFTDKKPLKRFSPPHEPHLPEKKIKPDSPQEDKKLEKVGGIKLIPAKPKPMFLEESDVFMNALTAANLKEPRKRKRRPSTSKDGASEAKKDGNNSTPPSSPSIDDKSPPIAKPTFKFYQDTLETNVEAEEQDKNTKSDSEECLDFAPPDQQESGREGSLSPSDVVKIPKEEVYDKNGSLVKGALVHFKSRRGPKKSVCWKEEKDLEEIRYFEMDDTERVNVTKNFLDMKQMERIHERENVQMARKLSVEDVMEEKTRWKPLIPCDGSGAPVIAGKSSIEKDIQYAREKTVAAAFYFNKRTIPDSPAEPDLEIHATTDPAIIPLEDITGIADSVNDFTNTPWPEPQVQPVVVPQPEPIVPPHPMQPMPNVFPPQGPPAFPPGPFQAGPPPFMGNPTQLPPGDWRTADGKILPMPDMFPQQPIMGPPMGPPMMPQPMMANHGPPDMGFPMGMPGPGHMGPGPEDMGPFGHPFQMAPNMGPPGMISPPFGNMPNQGPMQGSMPDFSGNNNDRFRNDDNRGGGRGNWFGPGGGGGGFRGNNNRGKWRGGMDRNRDNRGDNSNKSWGCNNRGICNMLIKRGFCKNNKCPFRHPSSNNRN